MVRNMYIDDVELALMSHYLWNGKYKQTFISMNKDFVIS